MYKPTNTPVIIFSKPTLAGHLYTKDVVETALNSPIIQEAMKLRSFFVPVNYTADGVIEMASVAGVVENFIINDEGLFADIMILDTPMGKTMQNYINTKGEDAVHFFPYGKGDCDIEGRISNYDLFYIYISQNEQ